MERFYSFGGFYDDYLMKPNFYHHLEASSVELVFW